MEEGLCGDEEGGGAHPQQHYKLQEPEAESWTRPSKELVSFRKEFANQCGGAAQK